MVTDPLAVAYELGTHPDPFVLSAQSASSTTRNVRSGFRRWGGEKFPGGLGRPQVLIPDYWELRWRSAELFETNIYARGVIRRLVTNEINTGLGLQAEPVSELLPEGFDEEDADDWAENVENRFHIWATNARLCDWEGRRNYAELQRDIRRESLIEGDVLVVLHMDRGTKLPQIEIVRGGRVVTPMKRNDETRDLTIVDGVELDDRGRQVAYWVRDNNEFMSTKRIPAFGSRSGRRLAWLVYGSDKRMDAVRGMPLLGLILQSLKELDRYRDSEQRAATINALLAMFIQKGQDVPGTNPYGAGAVRNTVIDTTGASGEAREFKIAEGIPGVVLDELAWGETPTSFNTSRPNVNYGNFEASVVHAVAWALEIPPEILTLEFSNNYSASKAAINEFKAYLMRVRAEFGAMLCQPIYEEWLTAEVQTQRITAPGYLIARRNPQLFIELGAWTAAIWAGPMKPSVDLGRDVSAYIEAIDASLITRTRASEDLFGVRHTRVLKRLAREQRVAEDLDVDSTVESSVTIPGASPSTSDDDDDDDDIDGDEETVAKGKRLWLAQ